MINQKTDYFETCDSCKHRSQERYSSHFTHVCRNCNEEICDHCFGIEDICGTDNEGYAYGHEKQRCEAC